MRRALAAGLFGALVAASCGQRVLLGGDPDAGPGQAGACGTGGSGAAGPPPCPGGFPSCSGRPCGEPCSPCPPGDPGCAGAPADAFSCDGKGACIMGPGCPPPDPCAGRPCGAPCDACGEPMDAGLDSGCPPPGPTACDHLGHCAPAMPGMCGPPPWQPCDQEPCGATCTICAPLDPGCIEPPGPKACDPMGTCKPLPAQCP